MHHLGPVLATIVLPGRRLPACSAYDSAALSGSLNSTAAMQRLSAIVQLPQLTRSSTVKLYGDNSSTTRSMMPSQDWHRIRCQRSPFLQHDTNKPCMTVLAISRKACMLTVRPRSNEARSIPGQPDTSSVWSDLPVCPWVSSACKRKVRWKRIAGSVLF